MCFLYLNQLPTEELWLVSGMEGTLGRRMRERNLSDLKAAQHVVVGWLILICNLFRRD